MDELTEEVPDHASIDEGYSVGCKSAKGWLALASAAIAVAKAFTPPPQAATTSSQTPSNMPTVGISPGKYIELCMKNLQSLRYVQQHSEEIILSQSEFIP